MTGKSHLDLALASMEIFLDDGIISEGELDRLFGIALEDGVVSAEEKRVLGRIFDQVNQRNSSDRVRRRIRMFRREHEL